MIFAPTPIPGVLVIEPERITDDRGYFCRTFCRDEFGKRGLVADFVQQSTAFNARAGTLRGMHYQLPPHGETKLVRVVRGALYDVVLDLREQSPTFRSWHAVELTAGNGRQLYVPDGVAHGYQTLKDETEVSYLISVPYSDESARGVRWDDPAFHIHWPDCAHRTLSSRDATFPLQS